MIAASWGTGNPKVVAAAFLVAGIVVFAWLVIEVGEWRRRRRPPGAGALRNAQRARRDRRPW